MTEKELYRVWAPEGKKWVDWVRPVAFVDHNQYDCGYHFTDDIPPVEFLDESCRNAALIVDLPGGESVSMGIALAGAGYRPIPVFNGTIEQKDAKAVTDNVTVGKALRWGAAYMQKLEICDEALPAFLTDSKRLNRFRQNRAMFDNSWDLYDQDLPSGDYLLKKDIRRVVVVSDRIYKDIRKILYKYQKKGVEIYWTKGYEIPRKVRIRRPLFSD